MAEARTPEACRADVWLWRARLARTRGEAARIIASGRVQRLRAGALERLDKPARAVRIGDGLVFAVGGRLTAVRIAALGARRGSAAEARALYATLEADGARASTPAS